MKKAEKLSEKFLLEIKQQLIARQQTPYPKGKQAREAAEQIIRMLPHVIKSHEQHPNNFYQLVRLQLYFYRHELIGSEPSGQKDDSQTYKIFMEESIPYYLCQYLHAIGCQFSAWLGVISVCVTMFDGTSWTEDFLEGRLFFQGEEKETN
jgi:hypothetical protein